MSIEQVMSRAGNRLPLRERERRNPTASPPSVGSREPGGCWDRDLRGERAWRLRLSKVAGAQIIEVVKCYQGLLQQELAGDLVEGTSGRGRTTEEQTETWGIDDASSREREEDRNP